MKAPPAREGGFFAAVEPLAKKGGLQHMAQGTVSRFNEQKGYGFISPDYGGGDIFVHYYVGSARDRL